MSSAEGQYIKLEESSMDHSIAVEAPAHTRPRDTRQDQARVAMADIAEALINVSDLALSDDRNDERCASHRGRAVNALRRAAWRLFHGTVRGFVEAEERWFQIDRGEVILVTKREAEGLRSKVSVPADPCLAKREPDEPMFILLGRDTVAPAILMEWCHQREMEMLRGTREDTEEERSHIADVRAKVAEFRTWRAEHR
jgi:hypothetical protein